MTSETWTCPARGCLEGTRYERCHLCEGSGLEEGLDTAGVPCGRCDGAGEKAVGPCGVCGGAGEVPFCTGRVYEAWERFTTNRAYLSSRGDSSPWNGTDADFPGVTDATLAMWWEKRRSFGRIVLVRARPEEANRFGVVEVENERGEWLKLHGVAWGYGGTGPNGLAAILADGGAFPSHAAALRFVCGLAQHAPFRVRLPLRREEVGRGQ